MKCDTAANRYLFLYGKNYNPEILTDTERPNSRLRLVRSCRLVDRLGMRLRDRFWLLIEVCMFLYLKNGLHTDGVYLEADLPYCGGDCLATGVLVPATAMVEPPFSNDADRTSYLTPSQV